MSAAYKIDILLAQKMEIMAYSLSPHPCAVLIKDVVESIKELSIDEDDSDSDLDYDRIQQVIDDWDDACQDDDEFQFIILMNLMDYRSEKSMKGYKRTENWDAEHIVYD